MTAMSDIRTYDVASETTATFGRVLASARNHHLVVDGPVQNGCPGEALTPPELFLSGVASCGTERIEVIARDENIPLRRVEVTLHATLDRSNQPRTDVTLFNTVSLAIRLFGVDEARGAHLVRRFQETCPLYGAVAVAVPGVSVSIAVEP